MYENQLQQVITPDDLMEEFIMDDTLSDDEISDSIFTCVDNYIDKLCIDMMKEVNGSVLEDENECDAPFNYIVDKVLEKIDTLESIGSESMGKSIAANFARIDREENEKYEPDYCDPSDFEDLNPEDFQLFINGSYSENERDTMTDGYLERSWNNDTFNDSNYNA